MGIDFGDRIQIAMRDKEINKLIKASKLAADKEVEHVLIIKHPDVTLKLNGTENIIGAIISNPELYARVKDVVLTSPTFQGIIPTTVLSYPLLPCSPYSAEWRKSGSLKIRNVLQVMVTNAGYGKYGKKYGAGDPPLGWPVEEVPWHSFKGVSSSGLTNEAMTRIILGMLEAVGIDPTTHVHHGQVGDHPVVGEEEKFVVQVDSNKRKDVVKYETEDSLMDDSGIEDITLEEDADMIEPVNVKNNKQIVQKDGGKQDMDQMSVIAHDGERVSEVLPKAGEAERHEDEDEENLLSEDESPMSITIRSKGFEPIEISMKRGRKRKRPRNC